VNKEISLYDLETAFDDPILDDSVYHPANSEFKRTVKSANMHIRALVSKMHPKHAMICRALVVGIHTNKAIAQKYRCNPQLVTKVKQDPNARELMAQMNFLKELNEGTKALDREMMLWGIAMREEENDPRTSIAAVGEINRMKTDTDAAKEKSKQNETLNGATTLIIQLSDSRLAPSKLDQHPIKDIN